MQNMKKIYTRFRIFLLTFAFGLACVSFFSAIDKKQATVSLELPEMTFESPVIVYPKYKSEMGELPYFPENEARGTGCQFGSGYGIKDNEAKKRVKKDVIR